MAQINLKNTYNGSGEIVIEWNGEIRNYPSREALVRAIRGILNLEDVELDTPLERALTVSSRTFQKGDPFELH